MEEFERLALLLDFYGPLLTERQKITFEDHVCNDLSITEIAQSQNISRQAAYDMIKRSTKILEDYEEKLHLVERFEKIIKQVEAIDDVVSVSLKENKVDEALLGKVRALTTDILEEL